MNRCVGSKCNRVCGKGSGLPRIGHRWAICLAFVVMGALAPTFARATPTAAPAGTAAQDSALPIAALSWNDQIWHLLEFIFEAMGYVEAEAGARDLEQSLLRLSESWNAQGLPEDMTPETALQTLEALADLEVQLLAQPGRVSFFVQLETLATIASMRDAIMDTAFSALIPGGDE